MGLCIRRTPVRTNCFFRLDHGVVSIHVRSVKPKFFLWWIQFLGGDKLVNWSSKKQDYTSMSSAEAEYVSLSACCIQVLWLRTQLTDYGFHFDKIPMYCDSKAAIAISCNPVQHSRTKHIDLADLFTKALSEDRFKYLVRRLGLDDGVEASFQRSWIHKPHAHTHAFKVNRSTSRSLILNFPTIKEPQSYNAIPPPYTGHFMPPKSDLAYPSLDDFVEVNESISESVGEKPTVETNEPKNARKENGTPIIKDWVSESEE
ncbi:hypothetical protein Tco_0942196 [Tanacetum coccineum]